MPGIIAPAAAGAPKPAMTNFTSNTPGSGAQIGGYNAAVQNLGNALKLSGQTTQAGQMQLGQQLQQNQANVAQNLTNRGLGNTTVAQTMQQAPLQTYNTGMAQLNDLSALRQMGAYGNLANMQAQGGQQITNTAQPYAQTLFTKNLMASMAPPTVNHVGYGGMQSSPLAAGGNGFSGGGPGGYFGPGSPQGLAGGNNQDPAYQQAMAQLLQNTPDQSGQFAADSSPDASAGE